MVHAQHLTHGFTHLLVLALALVGLTGRPTLPSEAAGPPSPAETSPTMRTRPLWLDCPPPALA